MKTTPETNLWSNVYWNQKNSEEDSNDSQNNSYNNNSPFNNPNTLAGAFGSRGFNQYSSGPASLPLSRPSHTNNFNSINDYDMDKSCSNVNSGPNSMIWLGHQTNNNMSTSAKMSSASSVSSQAWGEMMDSAIMDELTSMRAGSFSSLKIY